MTTENAKTTGDEAKTDQAAAATGLPKSLSNRERADLIAGVENAQLRTDIPAFRPGDTIKVHAKIVEGNKERIQIFEGVVIEKQGTAGSSATFTVRKVSYNVGVERKFLLHSPRIEKIEIVSRGDVRRAKLYYLRGMRGKAGRIKSRYEASDAASGAASDSADSDGGDSKSSSSARDAQVSQASA